MGDSREKDNLNTVDSPNIDFKHIIILNVIILVKDNMMYIVLRNASLYFNVIGKYNVLYLIQTLNQISLWRIQFTDWNENKKENLRFMLYFKKFLVDWILANIQDDMRRT